MNKLPDDFTVYPKGHEPEGHKAYEKHIANLEQLLRDAQRKNDAYEVIVAVAIAGIFGAALILGYRVLFL